MPAIEEDISRYIEGLPYNNLRLLFKQFNAEVSNVITEENKNCFKELLISYILKRYNTYYQNLVSNKEKAIQKLHGDLKALPEFAGRNERFSAFILYMDLKFFKCDETVSRFNLIGINNFYLTNFVNLSEIENIALGIIKNGIIINLMETLLLIDNAYNIKILMDLLNSFCLHKIKLYDKRRNVKQLEVDLKNIIRRRKTGGNNHNKHSDFAIIMNYLLDLFQNLSNEGVLDLQTVPVTIFYDMLREKYHRVISGYVRDYLSKYIEVFGKKSVFSVFKPLFFVIYENNKNGLLRSPEFEEMCTTKYGRSAPYDGKYDTYYYMRIEQLTGLRKKVGQQ